MFTMRIPSSVECNVIPIGLDFPKEKNPFLLYMFYIYIEEWKKAKINGSNRDENRVIYTWNKNKDKLFWDTWGINFFPSGNLMK